MIVDFIIGALFGILGGVLGLVPSFGLPAGMTDAADSMGSVLAGVNGVFPVTTLALCCGAILATWVFKSLWAFGNWVYRSIPFKMT